MPCGRVRFVGVGGLVAVAVVVLVLPGALVVRVVPVVVVVLGVGDVARVLLVVVGVPVLVLVGTQVLAGLASVRVGGADGAGFVPRVRGVGVPVSPRARATGTGRAFVAHRGAPLTPLA